MRSLLFTATLATLAVTGLAAPVRAVWNPDPFIGGALVSGTAGSQTYPVSTPDGSGGAFIAWIEGFSMVSVQRLGPGGTALWNPAGVVAGDAENASIALVADGAGGVVVLHTEGASLNAKGLFATRLDGAGVTLWSTKISGNTETKDHVRAIPDGSGGAIATWHDTRFVPPGVSTAPIVRVSRVDGSGIVRWGDAGVQLSTGSTQTMDPSICSDGAGGAIVCWSDTRNGVERIYAQRLDSTGAPQWTANGVQTCTAATPQVAAELVSDGAGGAIVAWQDWRSGQFDVYSQRMSAGGARLWNTFGIGLCFLNGHQSGVSMCSDGAGGAIVSWDDARGATIDVYAQRVNGNGAPQWTSHGVALCTAAGQQYPSRIVPDGAGGAIVAWEDGRDGFGSDIYARRIGANGIAQWTANGIGICRAADTQASLTLAETGTGSAIAAWHDFRSGSGSDIYAQRIDGLGYPGDPAPRITSVRDVPNDQGGWIKVSWTASDLDRSPGFGIQHYIVERYVGPGWLLVSDDVFGPQEAYSSVVQSAGDSIGPGNAEYSIYRVKAVATVQPLTTFWYSTSDSARSIDNLGPLTPAPFTGSTAGGITRLRWSAGREGDLAGYRIYRGASIDFAPTAATRLAETRATSYDDPAGAPWVYKLTAVDAHGNESAAAAWVADGFDPSARPAAPSLALGAPAPNPARQEATLEFNVPARGPVDLEILDVGGRVIRVLHRGDLAAGAHRVRWDLRDAGGRRPAPGRYFARLRTADGARTRPLTVLE